MREGKEWLKGLRPQTAYEVEYCVGYLLNIYLDNKDEEPMILEDAIKYCYGYFVEDQNHVEDIKKDIRFDGKKKTLEAIKQEILHHKEIKIKELN